MGVTKFKGEIVSTHSRLKAAGLLAFCLQALCRFNTQPPEGGCSLSI